MHIVESPGAIIGASAVIRLVHPLALPVLVAVALSSSPRSLAGIDPAEVQRLDTDLTPVGAERAGNAAGTIPPWEGGLAQQPMDPDVGYLDPYADDPVLFSITAATAAHYADQLSAGHLEMFRRHPDSHRMNIYPTRRSTNWPAQVLALT